MATFLEVLEMTCGRIVVAFGIVAVVLSAGVGALCVEIHSGSECDWRELLTLDDGYMFRMSLLDDLLLVTFDLGKDLRDDVCVVDLSTYNMFWVTDLPLMSITVGRGMGSLWMGGCGHEPGDTTLWEFDGERWRARSPLPCFCDDSVHKFIWDGEGRLWAQVAGSTLQVLIDDVWNMLSDSWDFFYWIWDFPVFVPPDEVWLVPFPLDYPTRDPVGIDVWSTDDLGLKEHITSETGGKAMDFPLYVLTDGRGITWVSGRFGRWDNEDRWLSLRYEGMWLDLDMNWCPAIARIAEDEAGNMWFGTQYGLLELDACDLAWRLFAYPEELLLSESAPHVQNLVTYGGRVFVQTTGALWSLGR